MGEGRKERILLALSFGIKLFLSPNSGGWRKGAEKIKVEEERQSKAFRAPSSRLLKYRVIRNTNQNVYRGIAALILFIVEQFTISSKVSAPSLL